MELAYAFLADAASVSQNGRFFVFNGGVESVICPGLPSVIPTLAFVAKIRILPHERGTAHQTELRALRPNGEDLVPIMTNEFDASELRVPADRPAYHLFIANFHGIELQQHGIHRFILSADEHQLCSLSFYADPIPVPAAQDQPTRAAEDHAATDTGGDQQTGEGEQNA